MKAKQQTSKYTPGTPEPQKVLPQILPANATGKSVEKKRKKHNSALAAAAQYHSPVGQVSSNAYFNTGLEDTGLNIPFREKGDIT
jgi:hypothetical protein